MDKPTKQETKKGGPQYRPVIGIAIISLLLCGLFFPLLITAISQVVLPYQANGDLVQLNGRSVGSDLIAENFTLPVFFHPRNASDSASGVDPHITVDAALSQVPRIHDATGIATSALQKIVSDNTEGVFWVFGSPYVNVLRLNIALIKSYPLQYKAYSGSA